MEDRWEEGPARGADPLDRIVYLSNVIGMEPSLVQPGGGNTSIKVEVPGSSARHLLVKGSGTDLRTIGRAGFTRLSLEALAALEDRDSMSDEAMMAFLADCMVGRDQPTPSVETPLHSLLPHRVIAHTHDVVTMSITNIDDGKAAALVDELFEGAIHYVSYVRPGFPLADVVRRELDAIPEGAVGLALAHHGLVIWADDVVSCYRRLRDAITTAEVYLARSREGRSAFGAVAVPPLPPARRREMGITLLPVLRGALGAEERVILHFDDSDRVLARLGGVRMEELAGRGMATPEHILRAGRLPVWLPLSTDTGDAALIKEAREKIARAKEAYLGYHARHAAAGQSPLRDWAKVVLVPGVGMVTAFKDPASARTAAVCYEAVLDSIENAEALGGFRFLGEDDVFEFEHWPLERRKVEESIRRERDTKLVPRQVAVVFGGGSGIGRAAAVKFAAEGALVVVVDRDGAAAESVRAEAGPAGRSLAIEADVTDEPSVARVFEETVLRFGGVDTLCYAAGVAPRFAPITDIEERDLQAQLAVHYLGAVSAIKHAARIMIRQGTGGAVVASVSKAAVAPGKDAVAYGGSKAALLQALRVAAVELGPHGIRVNAINADQVDTPLFRRFVAQRSAARGVTPEEQLEAYRKRNVLGVSLIPAEAVGDLAVLLASDRFRYTTGDLLTIDGGLPEAFPR